ncbi:MULTISPECIES: helix-turn-helix domain-containing protein [unclassified Actinobaculum]|uniref:helix-turn-helix domain-containing protein n=1 Tax=unclassified Actinobaculum TaxID=2609299 RepID=UPI000D526575|nr:MULTISPECIES: helix-turn-helix domain-containing protein [unclassified Actinobaculum]AWE43500.1 DNA-binding protein [Actinobaculum sp. 313]MBE6483402.1 DNA-binding protein [Actinomycetaceae bacterium]RTE48998.1 DNA-binding protein [Actinobaculum sp. 352]
MAKFLTIADVAEYLNVSAGQVRTLIRSGELPAIQVGGRGQWRIEDTVLQGYVDERYEQTRHLVESRRSEHSNS